MLCVFARISVAWSGVSRLIIHKIINTELSNTELKHQHGAA